MSRTFSLGIGKIWDELAVVQASGLYWINIDRENDANLFCQQIIRNQPKNTRSALICSGQKPTHLLTDLAGFGPEKLPLFTLPEKKAAVKNFANALMRSLRPQQRFFILLAHASLWQTFTTEETQHWVQELSHWLEEHQATLVILSHGSGVSKLKTQLVNQHKALQGLASLQWQHDHAQYMVSWWSTASSVTANQLVKLQPGSEGWQMTEEKEQQPLAQSRNDEYLYLATATTLEGAPPLSANWQLFENNLLLSERAFSTYAATIIFSLTQSDQIDKLARQIHSLRRHRGNALKIVVREMDSSLRYSDERLLLACGVNLIVPHIAPLSRFLTMIEGIQGQRFSRHVPEDINNLLDSLRPLQLKGYLPLDQFCQSVLSLTGNTLLPEDGKGVLVALRPVPGLSARQALTLCHIRRFGDIVTFASDRLVVFLSTCRINDLDTALNYIFRLPVNETFSNRLVWYEDREIISEVNQMNNPDYVQNFIDSKIHQREKDRPTSVPSERRKPVAITLNIGKREENT
ncbi:cellulose biosynthesis protein BcsE [Yersinia ruckeri]|uniref:cellulose biosynthesis protein BcsE n=1 Tax=Yersinia ruckeri TaxID=29486 RepID=UPI0004E2B745|nr:cellulose biosynthesis protein BcsE [Yersinia ruckeri]ARY99451.1 hypothetical protein QMA0440_00069 [Yersinia ruckeri]KFE39047.1 hypothetical protein nADLYRO1b_1734 [Yersinia ruckeri]OIX32234.1 cellulose biosynthesis protein BcsE [Yersinia ruckeri]OIX32415.1 cellulose biosynthesis protein BcsE [Yersinia ruckeri]OIX32597.1 cellulose biosynthesis protein BcsE [Yersinia ruckeri]